MKFKLIIFCLIPIITLVSSQAIKSPDYIEYHKQINETERLLSEREFGDALIIYEQVFKLYDFVFLRDYKVASQLALYLDDKRKAFDYIQKGLVAGW